ncbi:uncharacterized protein FMAN_15324 [Fusarium mangiferae]|uniref:Uncharacterized protein n=1 Tax=Fusarium mangiferae TaxID=192010 RepID=A0A1L7UFS7_FUSMA|nr:uncharacterized protein FMAN_15324 [Fusarium mangiferae]CVL07203.1 uncharacterized protein FMAN_15324 [Fusarium mangiferae]
MEKRSHKKWRERLLATNIQFSLSSLFSLWPSSASTTESADHEPSSSSDVSCLLSPSSLKSTGTSSRKVSPPPELKQCETKQSPAPEKPATESLPRTRPRRSCLPKPLADFKRTVDAGKAGAWTVLPLSKENHTNYLKQIEAAFRRFDYDPQNGLIAIRKPGLVHESFIQEFGFHLRLQLRSLGLKHHNTITGDFITKIRSNGSADIGLITKHSSNMPHAKRLTRSPDASFVHKDAGLSGVVVEVSYSQDGKELPGLARDYLLHSYGKIKAVIGFHMNRENKTSNVSVYKVRKTPSDNGRIKLGVETVVHKSIFRIESPDHHGTRHKPQKIRLNETEAINGAFSSACCDLSRFARPRSLATR